MVTVGDDSSGSASLPLLLRTPDYGDRWVLSPETVHQQTFYGVRSPMW